MHFPFYGALSVMEHDTPALLQKRFVPQLDITTYELATIVSQLVPAGPISELVFISRTVWADMPPGIQRHFVDRFPQGES